MIGSPKGKVVLSAKVDKWMMGIFKVAIWLILAAAFVAIFYASVYKRTGLYVSEPDAMDYGQIARHNLEGEWFQTSFIRPITFWVADCSNGVPDLSNPPFYSIYLMPIIKIFGDTDKALIAGSMLMHLGVLLLVFLFAKKVFTKTIGFYAMFLYLSCSTVLISAFSGLPQMMGALLIMLLMLVLYLLDENRWWLALIAGALTGLGFLTTYSYGLFAIPVGLYLIFTQKQQRARVLIGFFAVFIIVIAPWLIRNSSITGNPFFSVRSYRPYQASQMHNPTAKQPYTVGQYGYLRSIEPDVISAKVPSKEANKNFLRELRNNYSGFFNNTTGNLLIVFFLVGIFYRYRNKKLDKLRYVFYAMLLGEVISIAVMAPDSTGLTPFNPFIIIMGTAFFFSCLERIRPKYFLTRIGIIGVFVLINLYMTVAILMPMDYAAKLAPITVYKDIAQNTIQKMSEEDETVLSNIPWMVAWYADRETIWTPPTYKDIKRLASIRPYSLLLFAPQIGAPTRDKDWPLFQQIFIQKAVPVDFPLPYVVDPSAGLKVEQSKGSPLSQETPIPVLYDTDGNVIAKDQDLKGSKAWSQYYALFARNSAVILSDIPGTDRLKMMFEEPEIDEIDEGDTPEQPEGQ